MQAENRNHPPVGDRKTGNRRLFVALAAALIYLSAPLDAAAETRVIEARPGGAFKVHVFAPENPVASIVMFEGQGGLFQPGKGGFVSNQYRRFVAAGFAVAVLTPPADRTGFHGGMPPRFRETKAHARDIGMTLRHMGQTYRKPLWLLGISMGSKSVATFLELRPERIAGAIFLSSSTRPPSGYKSVTDHDLGRVKSSILAIGHEDDRCKGTPSAGAGEIVAAAKSSPWKKALVLSGGLGDGRNPCGIDTPHVFSGIETEVVTAVAEFIRASPKRQSRRRPPQRRPNPSGTERR